MNSYKMISAALLAGLMTACVVTDGSTDSITGISATDSTAGSTGGTGSSGDASTGGSTGGTGTGETATGSSGDVPTTDAPTSSSSGTGSTSSASTSTSTSSTTGGGAMCGWDPGNMYYDCGFEGEDPSATFPIACPDGLVEGDPCGAVKGEGCCDASGNNWYCGDNMGMQELVTVPCGG